MSEPVQESSLVGGNITCI